MSTTSLVFAAIAAGIVWWFCRPRTPPPGMPGLPPIPTMSLPTLPALPAGPAAASGGPHPLTLISILAAGGMIAFAIREPRTPGPDPAPAPAVEGLDLRGKFVGPTAAADAAITACLTDACARYLRHDPVADVDHDGTPDGPRLTTGAKVSELRTVARDYRTEGVRLADRQPLALDAIAAFLEKTVGTNGGPLDDAARQRWIDGFERVSRAAFAAAGR